MKYYIGYKDGNATETFFDSLEAHGGIAYGSESLMELVHEAVCEVVANLDYDGFVIYNAFGQVVEKFNEQRCQEYYTELLWEKIGGESIHV